MPPPPSPYSPSAPGAIPVERAASTSRPYLLAFLCAVPLLLAYGILWRESIGLPLLDDYHAILAFALDQRHLPATGRLAAIVTAQHGDYKLMFENAIVAAELALTGRISLLFLVWLGNLLLIPLGAVYFAQLAPGQNIERRLILFLPLCWILFQLTYAEMLDWAVGSLQALAVVCFSVWSFYLLARGSRRSFVWSCVAGALAASSSANGFVVAPIGILLLLGQRRFMRMIPWCAVFGATFAAYLYRYSRMPHGSTPSLFVRLLFVPSFLGGAIENMHGFPVPHAAIGLGLLMVFLFVHALWRGYHKAHPFMMATVAWVIATAVLTASVRSSMGFALSLSSRYKIYSALMLVFCYQYLADRVSASHAWSHASRRRLYAATLGAAVLFGLLSDAVGLKLLKTRRAEAITGLEWYLAAPQTHSPLAVHAGQPGPENDASGTAIEARQIMTQAMAAGIYSLPATSVAEADAARVRVE